MILKSSALDEHEELETGACRDEERDMEKKESLKAYVYLHQTSLCLLDRGFMCIEYAFLACLVSN